jgi:hypothetical protein
MKLSVYPHRRNMRRNPPAHPTVERMKFLPCGVTAKSEPCEPTRNGRTSQTISNSAASSNRNRPHRISPSTSRSCSQFVGKNDATADLELETNTSATTFRRFSDCLSNEPFCLESKVTIGPDPDSKPIKYLERWRNASPNSHVG